MDHKRWASGILCDTVYEDRFKHVPHDCRMHQARPPSLHRGSEHLEEQLQAAGIHISYKVYTEF